MVRDWQLLTEEERPQRAELAIQKLLNFVEALNADDVDCFREKLKQKKNAGTTSDHDGNDNQNSKSWHSSEKLRKGA